MRKKPEEEPKQGAPEWMTTYGDMVTLLLCFFVLLFSMSSVDAQKFKSVVEAFQGSLGVLDGGKTIDDSAIVGKGLEDENIRAQIEESENFKKLEKELKEYLEKNKMSDDVSVMNENAGLLLRFKDNAIFDSGRAELKENSKNTLRYLSTLLEKQELETKYIRVEGHTDNDQIVNGLKYQTNWELSVARSSNVVRFLIEENNINPERLSAAGYSEYHPVAPNDSRENKAKNRRVDILILKEEVAKDEL